MGNVLTKREFVGMVGCATLFASTRLYGVGEVSSAP